MDAITQVFSPTKIFRLIRKYVFSSQFLISDENESRFITMLVCLSKKQVLSRRKIM